VMCNGMYNNTYQIVQTPDSVMILTEMIHDVRVIPIGGRHGPTNIPKWGGDSVGWYEGDTLVVETINSHPKQRSYISPTGKVTERYTRWSADEIFYEFKIEDPTLYNAYLSRIDATYEEAFDFTGTENFYDAIYFVFYATAAAGNVPTLDGSRIANGMFQLLEGDEISVGPTDIPNALNTLEIEGSIELFGALGPPDFDMATGARRIPGSVYCVQDGEYLYDALRYDSATMLLEGSLECIPGF